MQACSSIPMKTSVFEPSTINFLRILSVLVISLVYCLEVKVGISGPVALNSMLQVKTLYYTEKQGFGYPWLSKKFQTHPPKPTEAYLSQVSERSAYPLQNYAYSPLG